MTAPLRGAILGFGAVAEYGHVPGWCADERFTIVAVADPSAERRTRAVECLPDVHVYADPATLLQYEQLDFVDVASPPAFHAGAIVAASQHKLHVVCEKPLVTAIGAYAPVREAMAAAGRVLHPVHNWKHAEAFAALCQAVKHDLGTVDEVGFRVERNGWSVSAGDWRSLRSLGGGGILVDHGWHTFYLALTLLGTAPLRVRAQTEQRRYVAADVEDTAHCEIDFPGCQVTIDLTWAGEQRATVWTARGRGGTVEIVDDQVRLRDGDGEKLRQMHASLSDGSHHPDWFPGVINSFATEIADRSQRGAGQREAEICLALLDAAYSSAARGGESVDVIAPGE